MGGLGQGVFCRLHFVLFCWRGCAIRIFCGSFTVRFVQEANKNWSKRRMELSKHWILKLYLETAPLHGMSACETKP
jgi:hypothetical protein